MGAEIEPEAVLITYMQYQAILLGMVVGWGDEWVWAILYFVAHRYCVLCRLVVRCMVVYFKNKKRSKKI